MSARPIGEIVAPIIARAKAVHGLQVMLNACPVAAHKKHFIMAAREHGSITDEETELLIQAYMLETE